MSGQHDVVKTTFERYEQYLNPGMAQLVKFMGFESVEVRSDGCYVITSDGQRYLDCLGGPGVFSFGHSPESIVARVREQLEAMPMSSHLLLNPVTAELAERMAEVTPGELQYTFFCNSGAEAVEGALKAARAHTGREGFVSTVGGFHGKTFGALSASGRDVYREPFQPLVPGFTHVPYGDADALAGAVGADTAAVILEPIQGEGGIIVPPDGYLARAREICDDAGALLILDEIQCGLARTGRMWGCDWEGVAPDIMTTGKALGGGVMPLGAFTAVPEVWDIFEENPYVHTTTFGGNPLACAAGLAALDAIEEQDLCTGAAERGQQLMGGLEEVALEHEGMVAEVRGRGLLIGVEFTDPDLAGLVIAGLSHHNILAAYGLNNPATLRFEPPLIITESQVDEVVEAFADVLASTEAVLEQ
ncbi:MAG: aminotransferase class III-fold pyridoxal phosphate-dependent enzyme [Armatimonadota bacterium]|nr:aminotransferase class III-fold pyridoxal phosphate-dependent enzyme [Armatimonadota bacterium]